MEMSAGGGTEGGRDEVERLAEEVVERWRRGERPTVEEYAAAHPELAEQIREVFSVMLLVEDLGPDIPGAELQAVRQPAVQKTSLQEVGEYRILRELGRGGMGVVYEAEQASLGRRVALKVLPFHSLLDSQQIERFQQEARAAARLSHPHIVPVYGVGEHLGMHYYVMQFIPGQGLDKVIEELRRLRSADSSSSSSPDSSSSSNLAAGLDSGVGKSGRESYFKNVARLSRDAALALDYAHAAGILHRDVKPSNLLLDPTGRVWLTDFGLAKAEGSEDLTGSGSFVGTIAYMAPERFKGWSDPRSDVYSLGISLYELLTLQPAFAGRDRARLLRRVTSEEPLLPRKADRSIPRELETVVLKAISKEPSQRYPSARAMAEDLERFLDGRPVEANRSTSLGRFRRWCVRNPLPAALGTAVLLLLVAITSISFTAWLRLAREEAAGLEKRRSDYLAQAAALRMSGRAGHRLEALAALQKAAAIRPGPDLVNEALACSAQVDMRPVKSWPRTRAKAASLSPDGTQVAFILENGTVSIRSAADDRELLQLPGPGFDPAYSIAYFSPDGKRLITRHELGPRNEWRVWALDRGVVCAELKDASNTNSFDFSSDGRRVILGARDGSLKLLDLATGSEITEVSKDLSPFLPSIHPAGQLVAFSSLLATGGVLLYDLAEGRVIRAFSGIEGEQFNQVRWHPDGVTLVGTNSDHMIYLWNAVTGERNRVLSGHWAEVVGAQFDATGYLMLSWGWDSVVRLWVPESDRPLFTIQAQSGFFLRDGSQVWTKQPECLSLWELAGRPTACTLFGHEGKSSSKQPHGITLAPGGRLAATAGDDGVRLWDLSARTEVGRLGRMGTQAVQFDGLGENLYASGDGGLERWPIHAVNGENARLAVGPPQRLTQLDSMQAEALGDGQRRMAVVHQRNHVHLIDLDKPGDVKLEASGHNWSVSLSPDGTLVALAGLRTDRVQLWNARDGRQVHELPIEHAMVQFDPSGTHLATCTPEEYELWSVSDRETTWRISRERGLTRAGLIAFERGGEIAAITFNDSRIWIIDAATGRKLLEVEGPEAIPISGLALEGGTLAASTIGHRIQIWDLSSAAVEISRLGMVWPLPTGLTGPGSDLSRLRVSVTESTDDGLGEEETAIAPRELFRPARETAFYTELVSYAQIDRVLAAPWILLPEGADWRFLRGTAEPSPGMEWTDVDFDDHGWEKGPSEFEARQIKVPAADYRGTRLMNQWGNYTTLYLRGAFELPEPARVSRLILATTVEDGFIAYLNGHEIGRVNAGKPGERSSCRARAPRTDRRRWTEVTEASPSLLRPGKNVLTIQVLTYGLSSYLYALPVLAAVRVPHPEMDRDRADRLPPSPGGTPDASLLAYREGRILERSGSPGKAQAFFKRCIELDPRAVEPVLHQEACQCALGDWDEAEALISSAAEREAIGGDRRVWNAWFQLLLVERRRAPREALSSMPRVSSRAACAAAEDYRWLLEELCERGAIRIQCGGHGCQSQDGRTWSADRFYVGESVLSQPSPAVCKGSLAAAESNSLHATLRVFSGWPFFQRGYRIPLPPGRYRVSLHFVEDSYHQMGWRIFDVLLQGKTVFEDEEPLRAGFSKPDIRVTELDVTNGLLELDFMICDGAPSISAIEIEKIPL